MSILLSQVEADGSRRQSAAEQNLVIRHNGRRVLRIPDRARELSRRTGAATPRSAIEGRADPEVLGELEKVQRAPAERRLYVRLGEAHHRGSAELGRRRLLTTATADMVMASACLPKRNQAVEIDGRVLMGAWAPSIAGGAGRDGVKFRVHFLGDGGEIVAALLDIGCEHEAGLLPAQRRGAVRLLGHIEAHRSFDHRGGAQAEDAHGVVVVEHADDAVVREQSSRATSARKPGAAFGRPER
jgi:hypothetical protein